MTSFTVTKAKSEHLPRIVALRQERLEWLTQQGSDQWQEGLTEDGFAQRVAHSVAAGETWVCVDQSGRVVGTMAVDTWTNSGLWSDDELATALIMHRLISDPAAAGQGIGALLMRTADRLAVQSGRRWLRFDAWTTNGELHDYYLSQGFTHVRTVTGHRSRSTALFERIATLPVPTDRRTYLATLDGFRDRAQNPAPPDHTHTVTEARVSAPPLFGNSELLEVSPYSTLQLWNDAERWRLSPLGFAGRDSDFSRDLGLTTFTVETWPLAETLCGGQEYFLAHQDTEAGCTVSLTAGPETPRG